MEVNQAAPRQRIPWNKGKLVGQKAPFKPKDVWAIRARMERERRTRELALFNLGIDSTSGELWTSRDEDAGWSCIARHLPEIYAVEVAELT